MGESQCEREPHLGAKEIGQSGNMERVSSAVMEGSFQGGEGGQANRTFIGESMSGLVHPKALQEDLQSLAFTPSLAKPEMGKKGGRRSAAY